MIRVVKKDGTKEDFNIQKVVTAVNKSAYRALVNLRKMSLMRSAGLSMGEWTSLISQKYILRRCTM